MDYNAITKAVTAQLLKWKPVDCWVETNSIGDFFFDSLKEKYKGKLSSFYTLVIILFSATTILSAVFQPIK